MLAARYAQLGRWIVRHRWAVLVAWLLVIVAAATGSSRITEVLSAGTAAVPGSESQRVDRILHEQFSNPFSQLLAVTLHSPTHALPDPVMQGAVDAIGAAVRGQPYVDKVLGPSDASPIRLRSERGDRVCLLVGLRAHDASEALKEVPGLRQGLQETIRKLRVTDPGLQVAVTGLPAVTFDLNHASSDDTSKSEGRVIPLTLLVLLFAFGGAIAAGLPLLVGIASTVVTLGIAFAIGEHMELSLYLQNVASMIGLAVGIDYSLLMVHRFRQALERHADVSEAVAETMRTAGVAVTYSGLTVLIGLGGMAFTPLLDTQSIGLGGLLVVVVAVLLALTLLPAMLGLLGSRIDSPRWLSKRLLATARPMQWKPWLGWVTRHPLRVAIASTAIVVALAWPATRLVIGYPDTHLFPGSMESVQGVDELGAMGMSGSLIPLYVVVRDPQGPVLRSRNLSALLGLSAELKSNPLIASVASPVDLAPGIGPLQYALLYQDPQAAYRRYPLIKQLFVSHDDRMALFQVMPKRSSDLPALRALATQLSRRPMPDGLEIAVGGTPTFYNDHEGTIRAWFPFVVGFVILTTLVAMGLAFRSILVPVKAVILNLMSVAAGYGAVVAVFQFGWGRALLGLGHVHESLPVPILILFMLFCIVFGLSMDYEVFLVTAIKESYEATHDNTTAIVEGTAGTARLISSAALLMVAVFGAFAWADFVIVKMLGLGLAVAVLVDATVIRLALLPAFMRLAGRANWYPGPAPAASEARETVQV